MEVNVIDQDSHYLDAWGRGMVSHMTKGDRMSYDTPLCGYEKLVSHVDAVEKGMTLDSILWLIEESYYLGWIDDERIGEYLCSSDKVIILSESIYEKRHENKYAPEDIRLVRLDKYQPLNEVYNSLKHYYLESMGLHCTDKHNKETEICIHFSPIWKRDMVDLCCRRSKENVKKRLIILMDGYSYRQKTIDDNHVFFVGLSEVFYYFHKDSSRLSWIIQEAACHKESNIDIIYGPKHMEDFNYLSYDEMKQFIAYMKQEMVYDTITFIVNGLCIMGNIKALFEQADEYILYDKDERIQQTVLEQTACSWQIYERG